jgi:hypothetical protein
MKHLTLISIVIISLFILGLIFSYTENTQKGEIAESAYTTIDELEVEVLQDCGDCKG